MKILETSSHILQLFPVSKTPYYALIDRKKPIDYLIQPLTALLALSLVADGGENDPQIKISFSGVSIGEIPSSNPSQLADFLLFWKQAASSIPDYDDSMAIKSPSTFSSNAYKPTLDNTDDPDGFNTDITRPQTTSDELHLKKNLIQSIAPLKSQFIYNKELKIRCVTWNLHAEPLPKANIKSLLGLDVAPSSKSNAQHDNSSSHPFDIYIIAVQESDQLGPKNLYANQNTLKATKDYIIATLGGPSQYQIVAHNQLLGILSLIVCSTPLIPHLSNFYQNTTGTGLFGIWGNKGAALNSFHVGQDLTIGEKGTEISILNCHLTHGEGVQGAERRRWELGEIQKKLGLEGLVGKRQPSTLFSTKGGNEQGEEKPDHEIGLVDYTYDDKKESLEEQRAKNFGKVNRSLKVELKEEKAKEEEIEDDDSDDFIVSESTDEEEDEEEEQKIKEQKEKEQKEKEQKEKERKEKERKEKEQKEKEKPAHKEKEIEMPTTELKEALKLPGSKSKQEPEPASKATTSGATSQNLSTRNSVGCSDQKLTFIMGDLNYRVALEPDVVLDLVEHKDYATLLSADKLSLEHKEKNILPLYSEGDINFPPTYKFAVGTDDYDESKVSGSSGSKARSPSYTDRIFYRAVNASEPQTAFPTPKNNSSDNNTSISVNSVSSSTASLLFPPLPSTFCKLTKYDSLMNYTLSDHKPVIADFQVDVPLIDFEKRKEAVQSVLKEADDRENSSKPTVLVNPREVTVKNAIVLKESDASVEIEYQVNANSPDKVLHWEISLAPEAMTQDDEFDEQLQSLREDENKLNAKNAGVQPKPEDENNVFLKSIAPVPSKAASRATYLSQLPHVSVPIQIYPRSGVLPPGGKQHIKFKCTLPVTRGRNSSTMRVAILRIVSTQDMFIPIEFSALPTSLGTSLDMLSRYTNGARTGSKELLLEDNASNMPKEIWSCVDYLWQHMEEIYGFDTKDVYCKIAKEGSNADDAAHLYVPPDFNQIHSNKLFFEVALQKGEPSLQSQIQEWLDTGVDFDTMVLDAANSIQDPDAPSFISYFRDMLESVRNNGSGGWLSSRNKIPDDNALFANSQIKYIEASSATKTGTSPASLLRTDKSQVGIYSVGAQFLVLLHYLDGSIIPSEYFPVVSKGREGALLILEKLPRVNVNVLLYVMSFMKLILDKEEEMVCLREAAERRVKNLLKKNLNKKDKPEPDTQSKVNDAPADSIESEKDANDEPKASNEKNKPKPNTKSDDKQSSNDSEGPNEKRSSLSLSSLGTAIGSVGAEFNAGLNRSVSAVRKGGKEFFEETLPNVGTTVGTSMASVTTTVASGVGNAFSGIGSNNYSKSSLDTDNVFPTDRSVSQQGSSTGDHKTLSNESLVELNKDLLLPSQKAGSSLITNTQPTPLPSHISSLMDDDGKIEGKLAANSARLLGRAKQLLDFMDPYIVEKPAGFKEGRSTKNQRVEFMLELMGM